MNESTRYSRPELGDLAEGTQEIREPGAPIKDFQTMTNPIIRKLLRVKYTSIENALISHEIMFEDRDNTDAQDALYGQF